MLDLILISIRFFTTLRSDEKGFVHISNITAHFGVFRFLIETSQRRGKKDCRSVCRDPLLKPKVSIVENRLIKDPFLEWDRFRLYEI